MKKVAIVTVAVLALGHAACHKSADNALNAAGNAVENAGNAVGNASDAVANAATNQ
jgi:methylmalonyl-CoA mutase cobalamin-binding subunit